MRHVRTLDFTLCVRNYSSIVLIFAIFFSISAGMYGLAAHEEKDENSARWMEIAKGITNTCHESYDRSDTKLGKKQLRIEN